MAATALTGLVNKRARRSVPALGLVLLILTMERRAGILGRSLYRKASQSFARGMRATAVLSYGSDSSCS